MNVLPRSSASKNFPKNIVETTTKNITWIIIFKFRCFKLNTKSSFSDLFCDQKWNRSLQKDLGILDRPRFVFSTEKLATKKVASADKPNMNSILQATNWKITRLICSLVPQRREFLCCLTIFCCSSSFRFAPQPTGFNNALVSNSTKVTLPETNVFAWKLMVGSWNSF